MKTVLQLAVTFVLFPALGMGGMGQEFTAGLRHGSKIEFEMDTDDFQQVVFTPNGEEQLFSWQDQSSLGGSLDEPAAVEVAQPPRPFNLAELMRPTFSLAAEWQSEAGGIGLASYDSRMQVPMYPIFGPPPPFLDLGFSYTDLNAPAELNLPADLYDYSFGFSWMRPFNERWMLRTMLSTAVATDGRDNSSDAWQFRGGLFAIYRPNERWTWVIGALALGRNDIPVVPALGAIWQPNRELRFDLNLPQPKISFLLVDNGPRQQWGYLGAGLSGGTWAFERSNGIDDQLTYRDWRLVVGWESTPTPEPGMPFTRGRKLAIEAGYAFGRKFEFEGGLPDIRLGDSLMLRATTRF